jgi:hypothetical protein
MQFARRSWRRLEGFAQVFHLKMDELPAIKMAGTMQGKQHAFDLVGLDGIIRKSGHVPGEEIGLRLNVGDTMLRREPTDLGCGRALGHGFRSFGHGLSSTSNITFLTGEIHQAAAVAERWQTR